MTIDEIVEKRNIQEILHFTTNEGLTGILATKALKPRKRLPEDKYLEYIYKCNCPDRSRDVAWHDYVNLSITNVNRHLFGISKGKWHSKEDSWWCILSFNPIILNHTGVFFTTTNNMYSGVRRYKGADGLEKLFAPSITRWSGCVVQRNPQIQNNQPTCEQAEVLYPGDLSVEFLTKIYVETEENEWAVKSIIDAFSDLPSVKREIKPELFPEG